MRTHTSTEARAARLAKFEREQLIVEYLNRGVSVAEIAARIDVSEKRTRAIIREILARRMPAPPEEFVAIQVSRLNEALLVAYSAMTNANLKAVDRVVRIVRELDRYHGFCAAERRLPDPSRVEEPAQGTMAFGAALVCRAKLGFQDTGTLKSCPPLQTSTCARRRTLQIARPSPPAAARFETRRFASLLSKRVRNFPPPLRQAKVARDFRHKILKTLNPRPGLRSSRKRLGARIRERRLAHLRGPNQRRTFARATSRRTIARKIRPTALKTLNPRPGTVVPPKSARLSPAKSASDP